MSPMQKANPSPQEAPLSCFLQKVGASELLPVSLVLGDTHSPLHVHAAIMTSRHCVHREGSPGCRRGPQPGGFALKISPHPRPPPTGRTFHS